ncbi:hypothetical protein BX616_003820, partial [Lobosporangium transversale]
MTRSRKISVPGSGMLKINHRCFAGTNAFDRIGMEVMRLVATTDEEKAVRQDHNHYRRRLCQQVRANEMPMIRKEAICDRGRG